MTQRGKLVLRICLGISALFVLPTHARASHSEAEEFRLCQATPDSPAKHKCVKKLLPWVKSLLFDRFQPSHAQIIIDWEDYLGIKDSDYQKVVAMMPILNKAAEIRAQARAKSTSESYASMQVAGYYASLGPEWKKWSEYYRKSSNSMTLHEAQE